MDISLTSPINNLSYLSYRVPLCSFPTSDVTIDANGVYTPSMFYEPGFRPFYGFSNVTVSVPGDHNNIAPFEYYYSDISECTQSMFDHNISYVFENAFEGCSNLKTIDLSHVAHVYSKAFSNCTNLSSLSLSVCYIADAYAFYNCLSLNTVYLSNLAWIGNYAFAGAGNSSCDLYLYNLQWPQSSVFSGATFRTLQWGSNYYYSIPAYTFSGANINSIYLRGCRSIGSYACYSIHLSYMANNILENIGSYAFAGNNFASIELVHASYIYNGAFAYCYNLYSATIGTSLAYYLCSIGSNAFLYCTNLFNLNLPAPSLHTLLSTDAFDSTPLVYSTYVSPYRYGSIYVPSSLYSSYKTATNWSFYSYRITSV